MGIEDALEAVCSFGRFQILHYIIISTAFGFVCAWQLFAIVFIGYINPHACKIPEKTTADSMYPLEYDAYGELRYSQCVRYATPNDTNSGMKCDAGWEYSLDGFESKGTMVMEWDLVCEKDGFVELSLTIFNVGVVTGFFILPPFGDFFGRKKVVFGCLFLVNAFGIGMAFANNFTAFCALQFITGMFGAGFYMEGFVLACEMFPASLRSTMAPVTPMFGSLGLALLALWAYLFRNWRHLQLAISCIGCIFLFYYPWCPESVRWLLAKGRVKEAEQILESAAKFNKRSLPKGILEKPDLGATVETDKEKGTFLDYLKRPRTRRYMIVMMYLLFVNNVMYYGLSLMTGALSGDLYMNFFLNGIIEIPAFFTAIIVMSIFGRRWPLVIFQLFSAVFMALSAAANAWTDISVDQYALITGLAIVSKFGVAGAFGVEVIYAQEIVPTNIRSTALGVQAGVGFLGSILAPYLAVYVLRIKFWIPGAIFAILSTIAASLTLLEPETVGRNLPETVDEVNNWSITISKAERAALKELNEKRKAMYMVTVEDRSADGIDTNTSPQGHIPAANHGEVHVGLENDSFVRL